MTNMDIIKAPNRNQIQAAVEWLSTGSHPNPDLEYVLSLIVTGRLQQNQGELLAIAKVATALPVPSLVVVTSTALTVWVMA